MNKVKVVVRKVDKEFIDNNFIVLINSLYKERRFAVEQLKRKEAQYTSISAGRLLQDVISRELGITSDEIILGRYENGKPYLVGFENFHFNISHSGEYVALAYGNSDIGIDIENRRAYDKRVAGRCFTDKEIKYVNSWENELDKAMAFTRIWTMKEAYLKCLGVGISLPLNSFECNVEELLVEGTMFKYDMRQIDDYIFTVCGNGEFSVAYKIENKWVSCLSE